MSLSVVLAALPTLDVNEGALNEIFRIYKGLLPKMGGRLVEAGKLNADRLEMLLAELSLLEEAVLQQRAEVYSKLTCPSTYAYLVGSCFCHREAYSQSWES